MCGISGFTWEDKDLAKRMNSSISYRGPNDRGIYCEKDVTLGHTRLSIIDLSKAGHQPMCNEDRTMWLVFNGEIYNFKDIRPKLQALGHSFASNTDSEVIIHSYEEYGTSCLEHFNGMFAFAIWDSRKKILFLARDRLGVKPLYYMKIGENLVFSSEIKALLNHDFRMEINHKALYEYLTYRFIPNEQTMLKGIRKLLPGHYLIFKKNHIEVRKYWDIKWDYSRLKENEVISKLDSLLNDAVQKRLVSDVPLGAFISGGLDSSLIAAINSRLRADKVKTFTVGFGHERDEFKYARQVSEYLETEHKEIQLKYEEMTKELPKIIWYMDEPNSDITMVPLYFLSRFSKKYVTVVNTGEGADELFSGYQHYKIGAGAFEFVPIKIKRQIYRWYYSPFKRKERDALFLKPIAQSRRLDKDGGILDKTLRAKRPVNFLNKILLFDIKNELPNWQLTRVDRMTMAHGMEARVPFLDYRIVELAAKIPPSFKQRGLEGKYVLKKVAKKYLPKNIVYRNKQGFTTPRYEWIREDLHWLSDKLLSKESVNARRLFAYDAVEKIKHNAKKKDRPFRNYSYKLIILLMLEMWMRIYLDGETVSVLRRDI
ncbi:MAG: asparagine synthase (glutamine-hydrolyzing) [Candidatus Woesearchaeota archaeon]